MKTNQAAVKAATDEYLTKLHRLGFIPGDGVDFNVAITDARRDSELAKESASFATVGKAVVSKAVAKAALTSALEAEAGRLEKAAIDLGPGHQDMKEIYRAKAAAHRARLAELKEGK